MSDTSQHGIVIVLTTIGAATDVTMLARTLVDERLVACVNALAPMSSTYRWKGHVEEEREQQLVMKTTVDRVAALESRLRQLHPYELPEFLVLNAGASAAYGAWIQESTIASRGGA